MRGRPAIRAVFFDLGDTLWHFPQRPAAEVVAAELARRVRGLLGEWGIGATADVSALQAAITAAWVEADRASDAGGGTGPDYAGVLAAVARAHGLDLTPAQLARLWDAQNAGGRFLGRVVFPDAVETVATLRERGFRLGVITNRGHGGDAFIEELRDYGLAEHFETVVSSDQSGYRKPHPRIFQLALERLDVRASQAVHVGDRLDADVLGARRAGLVPVWMRGAWKRDVASIDVTRGGIEGPVAHAEHVIDRVSELLALPDLQRAGD